MAVSLCALVLEPFQRKDLYPALSTLCGPHSNDVRSYDTGTSTHQVSWDVTLSNAANLLHLGMVVAWIV